MEMHEERLSNGLNAQQILVIVQRVCDLMDVQLVAALIRSEHSYLILRTELGSRQVEVVRLRWGNEEDVERQMRVIISDWTRDVKKSG